MGHPRNQRNFNFVTLMHETFGFRWVAGRPTSASLKERISGVGAESDRPHDFGRAAGWNLSRFPKHQPNGPGTSQTAARG